jgi:hypothetical protein
MQEIGDREIIFNGDHIMKNRKKKRVLKELFLNDFFIGTCFWSLIIILVIYFLTLPQYLAMVYFIFLSSVCLLCLPFCLYKIITALHLAKNGVEIAAYITSVENNVFIHKLNVTYEYDGHKYYQSKYFQYLFFPEKDHIKILIDPMNPSRFVIVEFEKKSVFSIVRERNR